MSILNLNSINQFFNPKDAATSGQSKQTALPSLADALATAAGDNQNTGNTRSGNSYLLDLSESAQAYLNNANANTEANASSSSYSFTRLDQAKLNAILKRYKNEPYDDTIFLQIQKDMDAVGISADKLAAQSQMRELNPTLMLLSALSGSNSTAGTISANTSIESKTIDIMRTVAEQWQAISTTFEQSE